MARVGAEVRPNWFIGWPIAVEGLDGRLGDAPASVRRLGQEDLHATLAFLGPIDEARARAAFAALDPAELQGVEVGFGAVVLMGHPRRGTALSAIVDRGRHALADAIARHRAPLLTLAGAAADDRPPLPHVTLARIGRRATATERDAALAWAAHVDLSGLAASIDRIALFTWSDHRPATQYRQVVTHVVSQRT